MERREKIKRDKIREFLHNRPATVRGPQQSFPEYAFLSFPGSVRCLPLFSTSLQLVSVSTPFHCYRAACAPGVAPPDSELQLFM